jgi:hypothetical protein
MSEPQPGETFHAERDRTDRNLKCALPMFAYAPLCRWRPELPEIDAFLWLNNPPGASCGAPR